MVNVNADMLTSQIALFRGCCAGLHVSAPHFLHRKLGNSSEESLYTVSLQGCDNFFLTAIPVFPWPLILR